MSDADRMADRRRRVAAFTLRGLTQREIVRALEHAGVINPKTQKPYDLSQVNRDLKAVREEWREERLESVDEHIAVMLAEIREVRRRAWANQDLDTVLKCTKQERDLLGLDQPHKQEISGPGGAAIPITTIIVEKPADDGDD